MFCNVLLQPSNFPDLQATCHEIGGQLTWFDTTQEFDVLTGRLWDYHDSPFNDRLYTGRYFLTTCSFHSGLSVCSLFIVNIFTAVDISSTVFQFYIFVNFRLYNK